MYAYIKGEDEHFCFEWFKSKKEADEWIEMELMLYKICYKDAEYGVLINKEFSEKFPDEIYKNKVKWRRLGNQLRQRIKNFNQ